ncbi:MAG: hypothetical protein OIF32_00430, partial [Campylobacterales bacterium]|nr:hypothetical protein [Campylobacterales bacterium]
MVIFSKLTFSLSFFLLFSFQLFGNDFLEIGETFKKRSSLGYIYYKKEDGKAETHKTILNSKDLTLVTRDQIGVKQGPFWTKLQLKNKRKKRVELAIYNPLAGTNKIDTFIYKKEKLHKKYLLGDLREQNLREVLSRFSMFTITLEPEEEITIISKVENYYLHNIGWNIVEKDLFLEEEIRKNLYFGIFIGLIALFFFYNILAF